MKKIQIAACLLAAALVAASLAGCGEAKSQPADSSSVKQEQPASQRDRGSMAKIVSLDGDQLTVILADMPGGNGPAPASGSAVDNAGAPAGQPGQSEQDGQPDQNGQNDQGRSGGKIQFTGEQVTYTLSTDVKITKGTGDSAEEIDLSELAADDVVTFTTTAGDDGNEVIDSIRVLDRVN